MNEDLKSSEAETRPQMKWVDLTMHTIRMVVAYDPGSQRKRLCLLGSLSSEQRRILVRTGYYEDQGLMFKDELHFGLTQLCSIFPYAKATNKHASEIGVAVADLHALHHELIRQATARPHIATATPAQGESVQSLVPSRPLLSIELVPVSSRFSSIRNYMAHADFNRLKKSVFIRAGHRCEICSANGFDQGYLHPVECHEVFEYDDSKGTQRISGMMSLCPRCKSVKNIELARARSEDEFETVLNHLASVNGWSRSQAQTYYQHAIHVWKERSQKSWVLNLSMLDGLAVQFPKTNHSRLKRSRQEREIIARMPLLTRMPISGKNLYSQVGVQTDV